jgi:uncharacterized protein YndB with AHSA1/START domain
VSKPLHLQQTLPASASAVFHALTDSNALETWFAEHASVSLADQRYDFWGRLTPETPSKARGLSNIQLVEPDRRLRYTWHLRGADTTVDLRLTERNGETIVGLWHYDIPSVPGSEPGGHSMSDVWCAWLENLKRYVAGRSAVRCDFSTIEPGRLRHTVEIDGPAAAVWEALVNPDQRNRWITNDASAEATVGSVWVDWGEEAGALRVLDIAPERELKIGWEIDGTPTVVTWTLEESGGKTRLTLAHSGFAPDRRTDGEWAGWLDYLCRIKSLVEFGIDWVPPVAHVAKDVALYYAASILARQDRLLGEAEEAWDQANSLR